jgi:hypothetical protein
MNTALLFPGQGSQRPQMLHDLVNHPSVDETLSEASVALGFSMSELWTPSMHCSRPYRFSWRSSLPELLRHAHFREVAFRLWPSLVFRLERSPQPLLPKRSRFLMRSSSYAHERNRWSGCIQPAMGCQPS